MSTTRTFRHKLGQPHELTDFAFRLPVEHRRQLQAVAAHRGWSEAEAMRRALALFLHQNEDLVRVLIPLHEDAGNGRF
jgi:LmbE family N-acetylglucosaminyl deacetylase